MAVNSKTKRLSMINFGTMSTDTLPEPDDIIDEGNRLHLLDLFSGNASELPVVGKAHRIGFGAGYARQT